MDTNKRNNERHRLKDLDLVSVVVEDQEHVPHNSHAADISFTGAMLLFGEMEYSNTDEFSSKFPKGEYLEASIILNNSLSKFDTKCNVQWVGKVEKAGVLYYGMGVQFEPGTQLTPGYIALAMSN